MIRNKCFRNIQKLNKQLNKSKLKGVKVKAEPPPPKIN